MPILGRFGRRLGVIVGKFLSETVLFRRKSLVYNIRCREATWADVGPIWGSPKPSKRSRRRVKK